MQTEINEHETGTLSKEQLLLFLEKGELTAKYIRINSDIYIQVYIELNESENYKELSNTSYDPPSGLDFL